MRSDYVLYGVAIVFFIIAGGVAAAQVPGYLLTDTMGIVVVMLFLLLGIVSAAVGYSAKPKTMMPTAHPQPSMPKATTEAEETPTPARPAVEEMPPPAPPVEEVKPEPEPQPPTSPEPTPPEMAPTPTPAPSTEAEQPVTTAEEEKPKPARRRRKKTQ